MFTALTNSQSPIKSTASLRINGDRLNQSIAELATIGQLVNGGVCRLAFTDQDLLARQQVQTWMLEAGMTVRVDAAGNIIGTYAGIEPGLGAIATGSHIDTVPVGGRYDGVLGVLAGIELVRTLNENRQRLNHAIEVIVFSDEENTVIGCKAMAGDVARDPNYYRRNDGTSIQDCLAKVGGDWAKITTAKRDPGSIAAFVELHVEQGGLLEAAQRQIGVVKGVVGQYRFAVNVVGRPNHAGSTPMNQRKDALVAASQIVLAVNRIGLETPGEQVATVGFFEVSPNAVNIVPGQVDLKIDLRDLSQSHLESIVRRMEQEFTAIAAASQTEITLTQTLHVPPTLARTKIMETIAQVCQEQDLSYCTLTSRAGHDAQEIGRFADMGMIFVPSQGGISHAEDEYTSAEQCTEGTNVLLHTFLKLDRLYSRNIG